VTKRVLIITNLCHSAPRIPGLVKYLHEYGWHPHVVAPGLPDGFQLDFGPNSDFRTYEASFHFVGHSAPRLMVGTRVGQAKNRLAERHPLLFRTLRWCFLRYREWAAYPDDDRAWIVPATAVAQTVMRETPCDLIASSSSPVTTHLVASRLKALHHVPWVADLRDLWTQNHAYPYSILRRVVERRLEKRTLADADALVSVSEPCCQQLGELHTQEHITPIMNGFDPECVCFGERPVRNPLAIVYTGNIYYGKQDPVTFLTALASLLESGEIHRDDVRVDFYGPLLGWLQSAIADAGLDDVVHQNGMLPREESFRIQREAQLLLMFNWEEPVDLGVRPLKTFEYLAAGRPIIATGGTLRDGVRDILKTTGAGTYCCTVEDTRAALRQAYAAYKESGIVPYGGNRQEIDWYSYRSMAGQFAELFDRVMS